MKRQELIELQSKLLFEVERRKILQKEIYSVISVSKQTYSKYKNKTIVMGVDKVIELGRYLHIDFNEFILKEIKSIIRLY